MKHHSWRYVYSEYWKVVIRFFIVKDTNLITCEYEDHLFFNIDPDSFKKILDHEGFSEKRLFFWSRTKKNLANMICVYCPALINFLFRRYENLYVSTDMQLHNYKLISRLWKTAKVTCIQHGYIPKTHNCDIDGLNSHRYVVRWPSQVNVLRSTGYLGDIEILSRQTKKLPESFYKKSVEKIIFIGPGFGHSKSYENEIFEVAISLASAFPELLVYRPHFRCSSSLIKKLQRHRVPVSNSDETIISSSYRAVFVGVKSTMLLDAQEFGQTAILIVTPKIPEYFCDDEIDLAGDVETAVRIIKNSMRLADVNQMLPNRNVPTQNQN